MSTKEQNLLLMNETDLIEGFLNGIKSPKITYLWSDFASKLIDGQQANGEFVERSLDRFLQSNTDGSNFNFENCIDWYWVYSNGYEEYSHTTCGSSCDENTQDACLDDGNNDVGGGVAEEEAKICGTYAFTSSGNSLTTEIRNLGMTAVKKSFNYANYICP